MEMEVPEDEENEETGDNESEEEEDPRAEFEAWLADQKQEIRDMYEANITGLKSALEKERKAAKEAVRLQKELDSYKTDEERELDATQAKVAELTTELTTAQASASEAVDKLEKAHVEFAVTTEAIKLGLSDPEDALALMPDGKVKYNKKTGKVEGTEEALKELIKEKPYLVVGPGPGTPKRGDGKRIPADDKAEPVKGLRF
jgi:4-hydroxy-L-threonine phosphate dehydrogenase PdxA